MCLHYLKVWYYKRGINLFYEWPSYAPLKKVKFSKTPAISFREALFLITLGIYSYLIRQLFVCISGCLFVFPLYCCNYFLRACVAELVRYWTVNHRCGLKWLRSKHFHLIQISSPRLNDLPIFINLNISLPTKLKVHNGATVVIFYYEKNIIEVIK